MSLGAEALKKELSKLVLSGLFAYARFSNKGRIARLVFDKGFETLGRHPDPVPKLAPRIARGLIDLPFDPALRREAFHNGKPYFGAFRLDRPMCFGVAP